MREAEEAKVAVNAAKMAVAKMAAATKDENKAESDEVSQFEEEDWSGDT